MSLVKAGRVRPDLTGPGKCGLEPGAVAPTVSSQETEHARDSLIIVPSVSNDYLYRGLPFVRPLSTA